jgi:hypothetical protein
MQTPEEFAEALETPSIWPDCGPGDRGNTTLADMESILFKRTSNTRLPNQPSMLVDLGSKVNVIGKNTEQEHARVSKGHGFEPKYVARAQRLYVNGVGDGSATCDYEVFAPIAIKFEEQDATQEVYRANIAEGVGVNLPAILGLDSMKDKDAVIMLRKGKETMAFPGPGGYKIEWSPGTKLLPMTPAPSGHLVVPCGQFDALPKEKEKTPEISFWTDNFNAE